MASFRNWIGKTFGLTNAEPWRYAFGYSSAAGKSVTNQTALQLATVWACTRTTAQAVAMIPRGLYRREANGSRTSLDAHPLHEIISVSPNADQTALEFWEAMAAWLCVQGNAFAEIARSGDRIVALNILPADQVEVVRNESNELRYKFTDRGRPVDLPAESVLHIRGFGFGGDVGLSPVRFGVQTFGNAIAADETAGKIFANGMMPSGVVSTEQVLTPEQAAQIGESLSKYASSTNAGKLMVLEAGLEFKQLSLDPESMQALETRRFHIEEICRWFGCPPIIVGHAAQGQTMWGTGVESLLIQWLTTGLNPFLVRIEQRISKQLLAPGERATVYARHNREALLQADSAAKAAFLSSLAQNGYITRNEGRAKLEMPRDESEGADKLTVQSNLITLDKLGAAPDPRSTMRNALGIEDEAA